MGTLVKKQDKGLWQEYGVGIEMRRAFIAHTGSCARPNPSRRLRFNYYDGSLQVVASPCWKLAGEP